jgi:hypothetical protein
MGLRAGLLYAEWLCAAIIQQSGAFAPRKPLLFIGIAASFLLQIVARAARP